MEQFSNIIISTRVRLARNINGVPFNTKLAPELACSQVADKVARTVKKAYPAFELNYIKNLPEALAQNYFERYLISKELLANNLTGAVLVSPDSSVSIMLNEEDHIRMQVILSGLNLQQCYKTAKQIDDIIAIENDIAYTYDLGYLTSCPSNVGTGMRASVMLFLPALSKLGKLDAIEEELTEHHMTLRGIYGEGSFGQGYLYQISNQTSLGLSEEEILHKVNNFVVLICTKELAAQKKLVQKTLPEITNEVYRAYGIMTNSYMLSSDEAVQYNALIKLGVCLDILQFKNKSIINNIFVSVRPAGLVLHSKDAINANSRDMMRAELVKEMLEKAKRL